MSGPGVQGMDWNGVAVFVNLRRSGFMYSTCIGAAAFTLRPHSDDECRPSPKATPAFRQTQVSRISKIKRYLRTATFHDHQKLMASGSCLLLVFIYLSISGLCYLLRPNLKIFASTEFLCTILVFDRKHKQLALRLNSIGAWQQAALKVRNYSISDQRRIQPSILMRSASRQSEHLQTAWYSKYWLIGRRLRSEFAGTLHGFWLVFCPGNPGFRKAMSSHIQLAGISYSSENLPEHRAICSFLHPTRGLGTLLQAPCLNHCLCKTVYRR